MPMVDLHLHLLPGVDDGCKTMEDALAMARALVSLGFTVAAPSPHNRPEYASREVCLARLDEVRAALGAQGVALALEVNAENFFLDEALLSALPTPASRRLGAAGKYLLVEAPYTSPLPLLTDVIFRMKLKGVTPLIAHPERCLEFERKGRAAEAVQAGALLQLDVGALIGRYGKTAQKLARQFVDDGLYAVAATDLHSPVGAEAWVSQSLEALGKLAGARALTQLTEANPARLLAGQPLA
ncbi:MAG: protein tyrosine phosphatase [Myxococcaceae bacterium]|jgi:protein-tyrosine phosphatase|nr:protein tyrosine phosphatase [Myxococcaceae bacterium]MCA3016939.1 protein tyrosine phosphatase [Myxococcaceae bacterium]